MTNAITKEDIKARINENEHQVLHISVKRTESGHEIKVSIREHCSFISFEKDAPTVFEYEICENTDSDAVIEGALKSVQTWIDQDILDKEKIENMTQEEIEEYYKDII